MHRIYSISILLLVTKFVACNANDMLVNENVKEISNEIYSLKSSYELSTRQLESRLSKIEDALVNQKIESGFRVSKRPSNCLEALAKTQRSGVYSIQLESYDKKSFLVYCDDATQGGNWTVIQRRKDGSVNFHRNWHDYKIGFGNLEGEFFIGLDRLHAITTEEIQELLIVMVDFDNVTKYAKYETFAIGNEDESYALKVLGNYSGDAGDSLSKHASQTFSATDRYNGNCASRYQGAWWYEQCPESSLNGLYVNGAYGEHNRGKGITWNSWKGENYSLKSVQMLVRPKTY